MTHLNLLSKCHWFGLTPWAAGAGLWMVVAAFLITSWGTGRGTGTCPSLPLPLLPYGLDASSDLSLPYFPPPLYPALPDEQVKRFIPCTQLNLCGPLYLPGRSGRPQTTLTILLSWGTYRIYPIVGITNLNPQRYWKMTSRCIAVITISWELISRCNCCQLFIHIAIHIVRELVWTLTFTSLKAFDLNGYFISSSKRQAEACLLSHTLFSKSYSRNYESSLSFLLNKAVAISFIEWGSE